MRGKHVGDMYAVAINEQKKLRVLIRVQRALGKNELVCFNPVRRRKGVRFCLYCVFSPVFTCVCVCVCRPSGVLGNRCMPQ